MRMVGLGRSELGPLEYEVGVPNHLTAVLMNSGHVAYCFRLFYPEFLNLTVFRFSTLP
jgi:hypothetical protein